MYICICHSVVDEDIENAVLKGNALTFEQLQEHLSISTGCGKCECSARAFFEDFKRRHTAQQPIQACDYVLVDDAS